jgi:transcriptional regulator with XRE-family HTH domain
MDEYGTAFNLAVAAELRAERARTKQTVASVVDATGLSKASVLRYLDGERDIPTTAFVAICRALGVSPTVLFERAEHAVELNVGRNALGAGANGDR